jgi:hypothetical protein
MAGGLDKLFGGQRGAAKRTLEQMKKTYGPREGKTVFDATVIKRQRRAKRSAPRRKR